MLLIFIIAFGLFGVCAIMTFLFEIISPNKVPKIGKWLGITEEDWNN